MKATVLVLIVVLAGCGALPTPKNGEDLTTSITAYNDGVRWERFTIAAGHIPNKQRSQFLDESDQRAHDVKITDYEIVKVDQSDGRAAKVQIKLSWYKESEGTLHETHELQSWERHDKAWLMVDESRVRGDEMPGLPEPMMKD